VLGGLAIVFAIFIAFSYGLSFADGKSPHDLGAALLTVGLLLVVGIPLYMFGSGNAQKLLRSSVAELREYGYVSSFWLVFIVLPAVATLLATQSPGIAFVMFAILALALTERQRGLTWS
jgi:membrane protease YdiL (CAAX protease family)